MNEGNSATKGNGFFSRHLRGITVTMAAAATVLLAIPAGSPGVKVGGIDLDQVTNGVTGSLGLSDGNTGERPVSGGSQSAPASSSASTGASQRAGVPPNYVPPSHGTNPHAQGDVATVELAPPATNPYPGSPVAGPELIVVGRSKGEQNPDGSYHGHITIAALAGNELLGVDTDEGQQESSALDPLNDMVLGQICTASAGQICLGLLQADSNTTANGSTNNFSLAAASIGGALVLSAADSEAVITDDGTCQTSTSESNVADADLGAGALNADAIGGTSSSEACNNGTAPSSEGHSNVVNLNGVAVPIPPPMGCGNDTANTAFTPLLPLLGAVCNADDTNGGQAGAPYNVREGLTLFVLDVLGNPTAKVTTAGPETRAVAPTPATPATPGATGNPLIGPGGGGNDGNPDDTVDDANVPGAAAEAAQSGGDDLAFTGADVLLIALFGCGILASGLLLSVATRGSARPTA